MMPITQDMLQSLIQKLQSGRQPALHASATNSIGITGRPINPPLDELTITASAGVVNFLGRC
jgi:hypothetical protein